MTGAGEGRRRRRSAAVCVALAALLTGGCRTRPEASTRDVVVWNPLGKWNGYTSFQTGAFISNTGTLRIGWETTGHQDGPVGTFRVTVHSAVSGRPLEVAVDHRGPGHDFAYVSEDPREFFLVVDATNLEWTLTVEEGVPGVASTAPKR